MHPAEIVHRYLKAANTLIKEVHKFAGSKVGCYSAKLTDFGLAGTKVKLVETVWNYEDTLKWKAPEFLEMFTLEDKPCSDDYPMSFFFPKEADVFSLAITCSEIFTCKTPYSDAASGISTMQLRQEILRWSAPAVVLLIERCWDRNPDRRPSFDVICFVLQKIKASLFTEQHIALQHGFQSMTSFDSTNQVHETHQFQHVSYSALNRLRTCC